MPSKIENKSLSKILDSLFCWNENNQKNNMPYIDVLRVVACYLVVGIHTSGIDYYHNDIANAFDSSCHYAVPIFVAISGACLIGRNISTKELIKKSYYYVLLIYYGACSIC